MIVYEDSVQLSSEYSDCLLAIIPVLCHRSYFVLIVSMTTKFVTSAFVHVIPEIGYPINNITIPILFLAGNLTMFCRLLL